MAETTLEALPRSNRLRFDWLRQVFLRPREAFTQIAAHPRPAWLLPLLLLSLGALLDVAAAGWLRQAAAAMGEVPLPPDFEYYSPEMQAQYMQAVQATTSPVFIYVFPGLIALGRVWLLWLLVGSLLHLALTLFGGRGNTGATLNVVAWAALPLAVRELVRFAAMLVTRQAIQHPGLSGFAPQGGGWALYLAGLLGLIDLYLIWQVALLALGGRALSGLPWGKALAGVLLSVALVMGLQALVGFGAARLGSLTIVRPFL